MPNGDRACENEIIVCVCERESLLAMYTSIWLSLCITIVFYTFVLFYHFFTYSIRVDITRQMTRCG